MTIIEEDISTIFLKDPEAWSSDDRARVVAQYREAQAQGWFEPKAIDPVTGAPKPKRKRKAKAKDPNQIDLEELLRETS